MTLYKMKKEVINYYEVFKDLERYKEKYSKFSSSLEQALKNRSLPTFLNKIKLKHHESNFESMNKIKQNNQYTIKLSSSRNITGLPISKETNKPPPYYNSRLQVHSSVNKSNTGLKEEFKGSIFDNDYPRSSSVKKKPPYVPTNHKYTIKNEKKRALIKSRESSPQVGQYSPKYSLVEKRPIVPIIKLNKSPSTKDTKQKSVMNVIEHFPPFGRNKNRSPNSIIGNRSDLSIRESKPNRLHGTYHYNNRRNFNFKETQEIKRKTSLSSLPGIPKSPVKERSSSRGSTIEFSKMIPRNEKFFVTNINPTALNYNPVFNQSKVKGTIFNYNTIRRKKNIKKLCSSYNISLDYKLVKI